MSIEITEYIYELANALGGIQNIVLMSNCATKLRYDIKDKDVVNVKKLIDLGAKKVEFPSLNHIHVKMGKDAEKINIEMKRAQECLLKNFENLNQITEKTQSINNNTDDTNIVFCNNIIYSTNKGKTIDLKDLEDNVFSKKMLGSGFAIDVNEYKTISIYAPVSGTIEVVYPTKHAYAIKTDYGNEVLVHIGINTSKLNGSGIKTFVKQNQTIMHGEKMATIDLQKIRKLAGQDTLTHIITILTHTKSKNENFVLLKKKIKSHNQPWFKI